VNLYSSSTGVEVGAGAEGAASAKGSSSSTGFAALVSAKGSYEYYTTTNRNNLYNVLSTNLLDIYNWLLIISKQRKPIREMIPSPISGISNKHSKLLRSHTISKKIVRHYIYRDSNI
jgi:hypothetical protein